MANEKMVSTGRGNFTHEKQNDGKDSTLIRNSTNGSRIVWKLKIWVTNNMCNLSFFMAIDLFILSRIHFLSFIVTKVKVKLKIKYSKLKNAVICNFH